MPSGFRWGQIGSASLVSLAHGTNDAQKTMGVITLALIATGHWTDLEAVPFWVKVACAVATGSILGSGVGKRGSKVNWKVASRMVLAWAITLPAAGLVGALMWVIAHTLGGLFGALAVFGLLVALASLMYWHSRKNPVDSKNVNDDWVPEDLRGDPDLLSATTFPHVNTAPVIVIKKKRKKKAKV